MRPPLLLQPQHDAPRQHELCQVATSVGQPIDFAKVAADVVGVLPVIEAAVAPLLLDCRPRDRFGVKVVGVGEAADVSSLLLLPQRRHVVVAYPPLAGVADANQVTRSYLLLLSYW